MAAPLNKYHWQDPPPANADVVGLLAAALDIPTAGARFLAARSYVTPEAAHAYLFADDVRPHDPFLFNNMEAAVERVRAAIDGKKTVLVHGDDDVDGISGTTEFSYSFRDVYGEDAQGKPIS